MRKTQPGLPLKKIKSMEVMGGGRETGCHVPLRKTVVYLAWYKISLCKAIRF